MKKALATIVILLLIGLTLSVGVRAEGTVLLRFPLPESAQSITGESPLINDEAIFEGYGIGATKVFTVRLSANDAMGVRDRAKEAYPTQKLIEHFKETPVGEYTAQTVKCTYDMDDEERTSLCTLVQTEAYDYILLVDHITDDPPIETAGKWIDALMFAEQEPTKEQYPLLRFPWPEETQFIEGNSSTLLEVYHIGETVFHTTRYPTKGDDADVLSYLGNGLQDLTETEIFKEVPVGEYTAYCAKGTVEREGDAYFPICVLLKTEQYDYVIMMDHVPIDPPFHALDGWLNELTLS